MAANDSVLQVLGGSARLLLMLLFITSLGACETMTYDMGDGAVDAKGRSAEAVDDRNPSDLDFETENPAAATEEEAWEDAVSDSER